MKPLYISSSGPRPPPAAAASSPPPPPSCSLFKISFGRQQPGPTPPLAGAGGVGVSGPATVPDVDPHLIFPSSPPCSALPHNPPSPAPFRIADILSALHTSLRPQQPSLMDWGDGVLSLGRWWRSRVEAGKEREHLLHTPEPRETVQVRLEEVRAGVPLMSLGTSQRPRSLLRPNKPGTFHLLISFRTPWAPLEEIMKEVGSLPVYSPTLPLGQSF